MEKEMLKQLENLNKEYEKLKDNNDYLKNIVANREEDINILYDNFKFSNLFLEDSIDKNVMFLFSKYLIANTCMVQIYNLTNDLHKILLIYRQIKNYVIFMGNGLKLLKLHILYIAIENIQLINVFIMIIKVLIKINLMKRRVYIAAILN